MQDADNDWFNAEVATFGDRVAAARQAAGLSQEAMAKRLGIKFATMVRWEDDLAEPRANRLSMMAGLLGVSISWLLTGIGDGVDNPDAEATDQDMRELLTELRSLRADLTAKAESVGRLEKRLRKMTLETPVG